MKGQHHKLDGSGLPRDKTHLSNHLLCPSQMSKSLPSNKYPPSDCKRSSCQETNPIQFIRRFLGKDLHMKCFNPNFYCIYIKMPPSTDNECYRHTFCGIAFVPNTNNVLNIYKYYSSQWTSWDCMVDVEILNDVGKKWSWMMSTIIWGFYVCQGSEKGILVRLRYKLFL